MNVAAGAEPDVTLVHSFNPSPRYELDAALLDLALSVHTQAMVQFRKYQILRGDEYHFHVFDPQIRVEADGIADEVVDRAKRLHPCKSAAGYYESEQRMTFARGTFRIGFLEMRDNPIAEFDCVSQRLHGYCKVFYSRQVEEIDGGAERQNEMIEWQVMPMAFQAMRHVDRPSVPI